MESKPFRHEPLNTRARQIRLLTILPTADSTVRCHLKIFDLDDPSIPDYRALSYTWGPPPSESAIEVNEKQFLVRQNLYKFLETFRDRLVKFAGNEYFEGEAQWLWIDQICIDQITTEERNHQVEMMADIYRRACYVYLWLGESSESTERVVRAMKATFRLYHHQTTRSLLNKDVRSSIESVEIPPLSQEDLTTLFGNPYWERLWIVQEVMLARYIRIFFGDTMVSWEELKRFCTIDQNFLQSGVRVQIPEKLLWLASNAQTGKTFSFPVLFDTFGSSLCADPSDRAYALLGVVHHEDRVKVEYGKSKEFKFANALKMILPASTQSPPEYFKAVKNQDYKMPRDQLYMNAAIAMMDEARLETGLRYMEAILTLSSQMDIDLPPIWRNINLEKAYAIYARGETDDEDYEAEFECAFKATWMAPPAFFSSLDPVGTCYRAVSEAIETVSPFQTESAGEVLKRLRTNELRTLWETLGLATFEVYHLAESERELAEAKIEKWCTMLEEHYKRIIRVTRFFLIIISMFYFGEDVIDLDGIKGRSHQDFRNNMHAVFEEYEERNRHCMTA